MRGNFNVIYNGMEYYGGHQEWLKSFGVNEFFRNRACGLAAISNVVYYYSDAEYCEILKLAYNIIKPSLAGIYSAKRLENALNEIALLYELPLSTEIFNPYTYEGFRWYVNDVIRSGGFIIMLNYNNRNKELSYHWVTITGANGDVITTSNWGSKLKYNLREIWKMKGLMLKLIKVNLDDKNQIK